MSCNCSKVEVKNTIKSQSVMSAAFEATSKAFRHTNRREKRQKTISKESCLKLYLQRLDSDGYDGIPPPSQPAFFVSNYPWLELLSEYFLSSLSVSFNITFIASYNSFSSLRISFCRFCCWFFKLSIKL